VLPGKPGTRDCLVLFGFVWIWCDANCLIGIRTGSVFDFSLVYYHSNNPEAFKVLLFLLSYHAGRHLETSPKGSRFLNKEDPAMIPAIVRCRRAAIFSSKIRADDPDQSAILTKLRTADSGP
jgi:hypothetical protein